MLIDSSQLSLHQSCPVIACISEFLLLQLMLLQITVHLPYFSTQGNAIGCLDCHYWYVIDAICNYYSIGSDNLFDLNRASPSEFVVPLAKYNKAMYTQVSLGMRFRMMFETEESGVRRYMGTITGISDMDTVRWKNSQWRNLQVLFSHWYGILGISLGYIMFCIFIVYIIRVTGEF